MDDLISRQAAIDALIELTVQRDKWDSKEGFEQKRGIDAAICAIEDLPSAERRGRWKKCKKSAFFPDDDIFTCSECFHNYFKQTNYCPNCGARMEAITDD